MAQNATQRPNGQTTTESSKYSKFLLEKTKMTPDQLDRIIPLLGPCQYKHESSIKLFPDERRAGVKNGRAGYVVITANRGVMVKASVYMDVENVTVNGKPEIKQSFRIADPKNVDFVFDAGDEKAWKKAHVTLWAEARTAKMATTDASGGDDVLSEYVSAAGE